LATIGVGDSNADSCELLIGGIKEDIGLLAFPPAGLSPVAGWDLNNQRIL